MKYIFFNFTYPARCFCLPRGVRLPQAEQRWSSDELGNGHQIISLATAEKKRLIILGEACLYKESVPKMFIIYRSIA
jgi:hypothetical protein